MTHIFRSYCRIPWQQEVKNAAIQLRSSVVTCLGVVIVSRVSVVLLKKRLGQKGEKIVFYKKKNMNFFSVKLSGKSNLTVRLRPGS